MADEAAVTGSPFAKLKALAEPVMKALDADILLYNGGIEREYDDDLLSECRDKVCRPNVLLYMHTHGGSADAAYRIVRCLQQKYTRFLIYIVGRCKSAGTLIAVGASEINMPDYGELGLLDLQ